MAAGVKQLSFLMEKDSMRGRLVKGKLRVYVHFEKGSKKKSQLRIRDPCGKINGCVVLIIYNSIQPSYSFRVCIILSSLPSSLPSLLQGKVDPNDYSHDCCISLCAI